MTAETFDEPFRHVLIPATCFGGCAIGNLNPAGLRAAVPAADRPEWVRYDNAFERGKWAMEDRAGLSVGWNQLLDDLTDWEITEWLSGMLDIHPPLTADPSRRGAGLHLMFPGGHLAPHLDYALHPSGLERRANLILFLDDRSPLQGGGLELCDPFGRAVKRLYPKAGEAVLWECTDLAYHAVEPLASGSPPRVTAAAYYLAPPRPGATRRRAVFLPPR